MPRKINKADKKVGHIVRRGSGDFREEISITKKQFEKTLERVFTTTVSGKPMAGDLKVGRTSKRRPSDGYNDTHTNQDKIGDKED